MLEGDRSDDGIRYRKGLSFAPIVAFEAPGEFGNGKRDGIKLQAREKANRFRFLLRPQAGVDLGHINRAARKRVPSPGKRDQRIISVIFVIQGIDDDRSIEEVGRHLSGRLLS